VLVDNGDPLFNRICGEATKVKSNFHSLRKVDKSGLWWRKFGENLRKKGLSDDGLGGFFAETGSAG
jgi:hypothetical protein